MSTTQPIDPLAVFQVTAPRNGFVIADGAPRASVPQISKAATVTRGARMVGKGSTQTAVPYLVIEDGAASRGLELSAVGAALSGGIVTTFEFLALAGVPAGKLPAVARAIQEARS